MNPLDRADAYLAIPPHYGADLGGLWWSANRDAVQRGDGTTLALTDEIRAVLDGVLARAPVPHFAFVLNLLHLMKTGAAGFEPLHDAFVRTRGVANRGRNVGLLIAELCRDLPADGLTVTAADVALALRTLRLYGEHTRADVGPEPPLTRVGFEARVAHRLSAFTDADLDHWFKYGAWPTDGGQRLAEEAESLSERVAKMLALARRRSRLVGAASLVPALDAALALPPRGRPPEALPVGGYCDVTTRGDPERLLPGQFALDPDEFVRRFAANELLYFKREEPHEAIRPERVIVLDQGVRTWGSVRLALSAAAIALARIDAKKCERLRLFLTSAPEPINPAEIDPGGFAERLEASDLTPNPNEAFVRALHDSDTVADTRDVILLTHRRSAHDPATHAGGTRRGGDRVFVLSVDESGAAELGEWVGGALGVLRSFRVDLAAAEAARPEGESPPRPRIAGAQEWTGDVEPAPFPFRPGLLTEPHHFGFDTEGDWLVIVGRDGILHGLALSGGPPEVLPRPYRHGSVLKEVGAVLGVPGGVVVCGRMVLSGGSEPPAREQFVAAHYDRAARRVTLHVLGPALSDVARWAAYPDLNCVTVRTAGGAGCALDLATCGRFPAVGDGAHLVSRAHAAWIRAPQGAAPYRVPVVTELPPRDSDTWFAPFVHKLSDEAYYLRQAPRTRRPVAPQRDGKPLLAGAVIHRAQLAGDVLALAYMNAGERRLLLLRGPEPAVLGDVIHPIRAPFELSQDGRLLARRDMGRAVTVSETAEPGREITTTAPAGLHDALAVTLATPFLLTITIGGYRHVFGVEDGALACRSRWEMSDQPARTKATVLHPPTSYDPARFPPREIGHAWGWRAVVDRFGQVLVYQDGGPLVAAFIVRRERAAAWIPGGVFWGDPRLIGQAATPDAGRKIGQAILAAERS